MKQLQILLLVLVTLLAGLLGSCGKETGGYEGKTSYTTAPSTTRTTVATASITTGLTVNEESSDKKAESETATMTDSEETSEIERESEEDSEKLTESVATTAIPSEDAASTTTKTYTTNSEGTDLSTKTSNAGSTTTIQGAVMLVDSGTENVRALELFSGSFSTGTRYAEVLNAYKSALGDTVNVYCMVIPTSQAYYTPEDVADSYGSQLANYNNIASSLVGVIAVPIYLVLEAHSNEYLYSRTDYHWQPLAAYYAAQVFADLAELPFAELECYTAVVREGYVGAFYAVNKISELSLYPDTFTYYKPANLANIRCTYYSTSFTNGYSSTLFFESNSLAASYTVFVGSDQCILEIDTDVNNDRVLVIFKDSYGNALVPFLTQTFSKIYLCDFRYFDCNAQDFLEEVGATDLLFAMSTVACTTSSKVALVESNLIQ